MIDPTPSKVPMEEVVRAFNYCIDNGKALYWATSEWSAHEIEEAHREWRHGAQGMSYFLSLIFVIYRYRKPS